MSLFAGIGITNVNIDSMFVVIDIGIDTSKCPTRQELCLWLCYGLATHLAATLLPLSKHTKLMEHCANSMNDTYFHVCNTLLTTKLVMVINKAHIKIILLLALL